VADKLNREISGELNNSSYETWLNSQKGEVLSANGDRLESIRRSITAGITEGLIRAFS